jgi:hypothetical protein
MSHHGSTVHKSPTLGTPVPHQLVTSPQYSPQIPISQYTCTTPTCHIITVPFTNPHNSVPQYCTNMSHHHCTNHKYQPLSTLYHTNMRHHHSIVHKSPPISKPIPHQQVISPQYRPQIPITPYTCTIPTCHITRVPSTNPHYSVPLKHTNMSHQLSAVHKCLPLNNPVPHQSVTLTQYLPQIPTTRYPCNAPTCHITTVPSTNPQHSVHCTTPTCLITAIPLINPNPSLPLYHTNMSHY